MHVCDDVACRCAGSEELIARARGALGPEGADVDGATWLRSPCLGQCDRAPAAMLTEAGEEPLERELTLVDADGVDRDPRRRDAARRRRRPTPPPAAATPSCGCCAASAASTPTSLDDYRAHGGYDALRRAIELGPEGVIREVIDSRLVGRGGAAFPTGRKWDAVARQPRRPHYLVCNADESEPGHVQGPRAHGGRPVRASIEAMTIAGVRDRLRARLPLHARRVPAGAATRIEHAIDAGARARLPRRATSSATASPSTSRCARAPAPTSAARRPRSSTRSRATAASRATSRRSRSSRACSASRRWSTTSRRSSTCCRSCSRAARRSPQIGTEKSTGPKLFCVCGRVERPGVYEVAVRHHAARAARARRRRPAAEPAGGAARRRGRQLRHARTSSTCRSRSRTRASPAPRSARASCSPSTTPSTSAALLMAHRRVLPRRVLRAVRALPRRHRAPGGGARAAAVRRARAAACRTSSR